MGEAWHALAGGWRCETGGDDEAFKITEAQRRFWAFQPLRDVAPPPVADGVWPATPIDRFVLAKLESRKLRPSPAAERRTWLRRATFDLTGLPPTPEEVEAFEKDDAPDAFARVVDRLLASPHYGERWGRHWLDVVRYADTAGETADFPAPEAWRYRNYVIAAFNADKPYDDFIREQLAGDLLATSAPPEKYADLIVATGYLAVARRFGFDPSADHYLTIEDTIDTLGKSMLGMTLGCARCHDHKYDPISAADYYGLYGIFDSRVTPSPAARRTTGRRIWFRFAAGRVCESRRPAAKRLTELDAERKSSRAACRREDPPPPRLAELNREKDAVAARLSEVPVAMPSGRQVASRGCIAAAIRPTSAPVPRKFVTIFGDEPVHRRAAGDSRSPAG